MKKGAVPAEKNPADGEKRQARGLPGLGSKRSKQVSAATFGRSDAPVSQAATAAGSSAGGTKM